jgi:nitrogen fixation NifU-like protein
MDNQELYQQVIIDHARNPRHKKTMEEPTGLAAGKNPVCGDEIIVFVKANNGTVEEVTFGGHGCAICTASASLMADQIKGRSIEEAERVINLFHAMLVDDNVPDDLDELGKCEILEGVRQYPLRIKCATLAWHALAAALKSDGSEKEVSTE